MGKTFSDISVLEIKKDNAREFEEILSEMAPFIREEKDFVDLKIVKRDHKMEIKDMKEFSPKELDEKEEYVRYIFYIEFKTIESFSISQKNIFEKYNDKINKLSLKYKDKILGNRIY